MPLLIKRLLAWLIDYCLIMAYALLLFGLVSLGQPRLAWQPLTHPLPGQLIGFLSLTLPVLLYSILTEGSAWQATLGKKWLGLRVTALSGSHRSHILRRNVLKYLPWEVAHSGVHWSVYYAEAGQKIPLWGWLLLVLPQIVVLGYGLQLLRSRGRQTAYDWLAATQLQGVEETGAASRKPG